MLDHLIHEVILLEEVKDDGADEDLHRRRQKERHTPMDEHAGRTLLHLNMSNRKLLWWAGWKRRAWRRGMWRGSLRRCLPRARPTHLSPPAAISHRDPRTQPHHRRRTQIQRLLAQQHITHADLAPPLPAARRRRKNMRPLTSDHLRRHGWDARGIRVVGSNAAVGKS